MVAGTWRSNIVQEAVVLGAVEEVGVTVGGVNANFLPLAMAFRV